MKAKELKSVFIVEDSEMEREIMKDHLRKISGLKISGYSSGNACIKELLTGRVNEPDLILMDYFLDSSFGPSGDGMESLTKLKEVFPNTSVIMFTSVNNEKVIELCKKKGALDFVVKGPEAFDQLDSILKKHFALKN